MNGAFRKNWIRNGHIGGGGSLEVADIGDRMRDAGYDGLAL